MVPPKMILRLPRSSASRPGCVPTSAAASVQAPEPAKVFNDVRNAVREQIIQADATAGFSRVGRGAESPGSRVAQNAGSHQVASRCFKSRVADYLDHTVTQ